MLCYYYHHHHHLLYEGIYTYIPETIYVSVAAVLLLLFMVLISLVSMLNLLSFYVSTFRSMCAVPNYNYYYYYYYYYHHHLLYEGIYTYIPETNSVPREYSVAAIL